MRGRPKSYTEAKMDEIRPAPERIWLQPGCGDQGYGFDATWHWEPIGEADIEEVEYVRADIQRSTPEQEPVGYGPASLGNDLQNMRDRKIRMEQIGITANRVYEDDTMLFTHPPTVEQEPVGRLIFEAQTGLYAHSRFPRYTHGMDAVIPACDKVVPVYLSPQRESGGQEAGSRDPDAMCHASHWKMLLTTYDSLTICPYDAAKVESARQQGSEGPPWPVWIGTSPSAEPQRASGERDLLRRLVSAYETEPYPQAGGNPIGELVSEARVFLSSPTLEPTERDWEASYDDLGRSFLELGAVVLEVCGDIEALPEDETGTNESDVALSTALHKLKSAIEKAGELPPRRYLQRKK